MSTEVAAGSVLIEVDAHPTLVNAAETFFRREDFRDIMRDYTGPFYPSDIEVDRNFAALPVGPGSRILLPPTPEHVSRIPAELPLNLLESFDPRKSAKFVIRGFFKNIDVLKRLTRGTADADPIFHADPSIVGLLTPALPTCGTSQYVGNTDTVRHKLHVGTLADFGLDGSNIALAIVDSGIYLPRITRLLGDVAPSGFTPNVDRDRSWKENVVTEPFGHRLGHGTMCAYDALIAAPNATLLDYAILLGRPTDTTRLEATLAAAMSAYGQLINSRRSASWPYRGLVVSNSWGAFHPSEDIYPPGTVNRYIDNPKHVLRVYIQMLAAADADVIFCGNNCGCCCPAPNCLSQTAGMIMGANSYPEVLTVGGCDTGDELVGYSSRGPSIAGMFPEKPDLLAYTHFLGSKTRRMFVPDTGVSAACPVAAGCVAALRTRASPATVHPADLFDILRTTARKVTGTGWDPGYGHGIINPVAAAFKLNLIP